MPKLVSQETPDIQQVECWDSKRYIPENEPAQEKFLMEVVDRRQSDGQFFLDICPESGAPDNVMSAAFEIGRLPGSKTETQVMHLHFDFDNLAVSIFKQGDRYILRPESDVRLRPTVLPNGEPAWIVE